ncbi:MAG: outer membrane lipoprotein carrier protein LolA [Pseudomonadota bacterium]
MLALPLAATFPSSVLAQKIPLGSLSNYLNALQTAEGAFTQVNADGSVSTGTIFIKRPGRVRFEYAPPEKTMVIAGGGQLAVFDARSDEPTRYPLRETPLSIILQDNVNLARANMVTAHIEDGQTTKVRAQDPQNPEYGSIELVFTGNPVQLRQWVINDGQGGSTTVILGDLQIGGRVPDRLFNIRAEMRDWAN